MGCICGLCVCVFVCVYTKRKAVVIGVGRTDGFHSQLFGFEQQSALCGKCIGLKRSQPVLTGDA